jgi:ribosome maturation factor RimP
MSVSAGFLDRIKALARDVSEREGCRLYDVEMSTGGRGRVLRVYIDRIEGAVNVDDCANVSRGLNLLLDEEDVVPGGAYDLEVSSPGLERKLSESWHFERAVGQMIRVRLKEPVTTLEGELVQANSDGIVLRVKDQEMNFNLGAIEKAQVRFMGLELKGKKKR